MSIKVLSWVWENSPAKGSELLLLLAIADFADDEGCAFPSVQTLARKTRTSNSSVFRATKSLVAKGLLDVSERGTGRATNRYRIIPSGSNLTPQGGQSDTTTNEEEEGPEGVVVSECNPRGVNLTTQGGQSDYPGVSTVTDRTVTEPSSTYVGGTPQLPRERGGGAPADVVPLVDALTTEGLVVTWDLGFVEWDLIRRAISRSGIPALVEYAKRRDAASQTHAYSARAWVKGWDSLPTLNSGAALVPTHSARPSTTDQRVADGMALAARLAAEDGVPLPIFNGTRLELEP